MDLSENKEVQADLPIIDSEETHIKIKPAERVKLHPKVPIEPSPYGKGKSYSRPWILQDGREVPNKGSEMRDNFKIPKKSNAGQGIRKRMLTNFFWEQILDEVIEEMSTVNTSDELCTEYDSHYVKDQFIPRNLEETADRTMHLKYPLYGTGSSAITFYSETIKKIGPGEILEKFRRCQYFTRPMEERLDDGWVL
ncbi:uncharacterized protein LOC106710032 [Papilio machaon]|uniref:uncharacterized protein LOC106710032 n=1 Tax=Papilio machaon TaxID=76193 RepID=UPI001E66375B|nr:uncharacterized protein LOC106710032 [Papilio machaon]